MCRVLTLVLIVWLLSACNAGDKTVTRTASSAKPVVPARPAASVNADENYRGPETITRNIIQARNGDIWLASFDGVFRYDGVDFSNITQFVSSPPLSTTPGSEDPLAKSLGKGNSPRFFSILEDRKGGIWMGSIGAGLYHYDGENFRNLTTANGLAGNEVTAIYQDTDGTIWIGTEGGVSQYAVDTFFNITAHDGLPFGEVTSISQGPDGQYWFGLRGGLVSYDGTSLITHTRPDGKGFGNVRSVIHDSNGNLWAGGSGGLWRFNGDMWRVYTTNFIGSVYQDRSGNIWTTGVDDLPGGGGSAFTRYDAKTLDDPAATPTIIPTEKRMNFCILEDDEGVFWLGSLGEVYLYDGENVSRLRDR